MQTGYKVKVEILLVLAVMHIWLWSESSQFPVCATALKVTQLLGEHLAGVWRVYHAVVSLWLFWPLTSSNHLPVHQGLHIFFPIEQRLSERHELVSTPVWLRPNWTTPIPTPSNRPGDGKYVWAQLDYLAWVHLKWILRFRTFRSLPDCFLCVSIKLSSLVCLSLCLDYLFLPQPLPYHLVLFAWQLATPSLNAFCFSVGLFIFDKPHLNCQLTLFCNWSPIFRVLRLSLFFCSERSIFYSLICDSVTCYTVTKTAWKT